MNAPPRLFLSKAKPSSPLSFYNVIRDVPNGSGNLMVCLHIYTRIYLYRYSCIDIDTLVPVSNVLYDVDVPNGSGKRMVCPINRNESLIRPSRPAYGD